MFLTSGDLELVKNTRVTDGPRVCHEVFFHWCDVTRKVLTYNQVLRIREVAKTTKRCAHAFSAASGFLDFVDDYVKPEEVIVESADESSV